MSAALTGLNQIPGVIGSVIFNANDECVLHMMPPPFEADLLRKVMGELRNALNVLSYLDDTNTWGAFVLRFDSGYVVVRNVAGMTVMVIAQPTLNPAMLSVGFNVAALKLEKEGLPAPLPLPLPPPPPGPPSHHYPRQTTGQVAVQQPSTPPLSQSQPITQSQPIHQSSPNVSQSGSNPGSSSNPRLASASISGFKSDSMGDGGLGVPDAVGKNVMDSLLKALARHIGPFAKLIIKEELTKMGMTPMTLGLAQYDDFITMLSRRLQDPNKRREFVTEAESLPKR